MRDKETDCVVIEDVSLGKVLKGRPCPQLGVELAEADSLHPPNYTSKRGDWSICESFSSLAEVNLAHLRFRNAKYH